MEPTGVPVDSDPNKPILEICQYQFGLNKTAIVPWFCLRLPSFSPGFESQAYNLCFFQFVLLKL